MHQHPDPEFMRKAIQEAERAVTLGRYPIGALIVNPLGEVLATAHTTIRSACDATAHAELNAIREACAQIQNRYLMGCWLYSTMEPCAMCASAAVWAKLGGIVFGATREDAQLCAKNMYSEKLTWRQIDIASKDILEKGDIEIGLVEGFMRDECCKLFDLVKK